MADYASLIRPTRYALSPTRRGEFFGGQTKSFPRRVRVRVMPTTTQRFLRLRKKEGRRSAERRNRPLSAPHRRMLPSASASGAEAGQQTSVRLSALICLAGPARLPAARRGAGQSDRTLRLSPGRASRDAVRRRYLRLFIALKRCTSHAGRCAGGDDVRTARERGYKPRPQEPHSLHRSAVTGRRPLDERDSAANVSETVTNVNGNVTHGSRRRLVQSCGAKRAARLLTSP
jgi:hypothetical protein